MLPFEPEKGNLLARRYSAALDRVYELDEMKGADRPGVKREHVFDFRDGLRVIVSRERYEDGTVVLHWSTSMDENHARECLDDVETYMKLVMRHMGELWADVGPMVGRVMVKSTPGGVFHFFIKEGEAAPGLIMGDLRMN